MNTFQQNIYEDISDRLLKGNSSVSRQDAITLAGLDVMYLPKIVNLSNIITSRYHEEGVYLCSIISARTGACPEDCSYCGQSVFNKPLMPHHRFLEPQKILTAAREAEKSGASEFCIVSSGRGPDNTILKKVVEAAELILEHTELSVGCSLGILEKGQAKILADAGVTRYNHNLETSRSFYPRICTTHSYDDRLRTAKLVKESGLKLCCGGIFGLGESWSDRIDLAFTLKELKPEVVPLNFLDPRQGTPLEYNQFIEPLEAIKIISIFRLILRDSIILCAGGREKILQEYQSMALAAGSNAFITGDYLTTKGNEPGKDRDIIEDLGMKILRFS